MTEYGSVRGVGQEQGQTAAQQLAASSFPAQISLLLWILADPADLLRKFGSGKKLVRIPHLIIHHSNVLHR